MSGLVRGDRLAEVRPVQLLAAGKRPAAPAAPAEPDPAVQLETELAALRDRLAAERADQAAALKAEYQRGYDKGLAERDERSERQLDLLEAGLAEAVGRWDARLDRMNGLAISIAQAVLARMIGNPDWKAELVAQAVVDRIATLRQESRLVIAVSKADFPDDASQPATGDRVHIVARDDLESGQCEVDLAMGQLKLGPDAQWAEASRLLDRLAAEASGPC